MSKFFAGLESESESEEEIVEQQQQQQQQVQTVTRKLKVVSESEEEEDQKRVLLSEKDKKLGKLNDVYRKLMKCKENDWVNINKEYDEMMKQHSKLDRLIEKDGQPDYFILGLIQINERLEIMNNSGKQKLSKTNNTAYNGLNRKMKKMNKDYENDIIRIKQKQKEGDSDRQQQQQQQQQQQEKEPSDPLDYLDSSGDEQYLIDDEDDDMFKNQKDDDSELSDNEYQNTNDPMIRRLRWLKKAPKDEKDKQEERKRILDDKQKDKEQRLKDIKKRQIQNEKDKNYDNVGINQKQKSKITKDQADIEIKAIMQSRVKQQDNNEENLNKLLEILDLYDDKAKRLQIIVIIFAVRFDLSKSQFPLYMKRNYWLQNLQNLKECLEIVQQLNDKQIEKVQGFQEEDFKYNRQVFQSFISNQYETLEIELNKSFRNIEVVNQEYIERMNDSPCLMSFGKTLFNYYQQQDDQPNLQKIAKLLLENIYCLQKEQVNKLNNEFYVNLDLESEVKKYYELMMNSEIEQKQKVKSKLYYIYHLAIHDKYYLAKDMLIMSRIQDIIQYQDSQLQMLFNRTIVQMGICAFRIGNYHDSFNFLNEMMQMQKTKELLGQGISKQSLNEKEERKRQVYFHLYINSDMVETIYYIDCMLLEVISIQNDPYDQKKNTNKSFFRKNYDFYEKNQYFTLPENNKETVLTATKELIKGKWNTAFELVMGLKWMHSVGNAQLGIDNLKRIMKEKGLQCYLNYNKNCFTNIHLSYLQDIFEMGSEQMRSMISKLILNKEIIAILDYQNKTILFEHNDISQLQKISVQFTDKLSQQLTHNERIYDSKIGGDYEFNKEVMPESILQAKQTKQKTKQKKTTKQKQQKKRK